MLHHFVTMFLYLLLGVGVKSINWTFLFRETVLQSLGYLFHSENSNKLIFASGFCHDYLWFWLQYRHESWKEMSLDFAYIFWYENYTSNESLLSWYGVMLWYIKMKLWPKCSWRELNWRQSIFVLISCKLSNSSAYFQVKE